MPAGGEGTERKGREPLAKPSACCASPRLRIGRRAPACKPEGGGRCVEPVHVPTEPAAKRAQKRKRDTRIPGCRVRPAPLLHGAGRPARGRVAPAGVRALHRHDFVTGMHSALTGLERAMRYRRCARPPRFALRQPSPTLRARHRSGLVSSPARSGLRRFPVYVRGQTLRKSLPKISGRFPESRMTCRRECASTATAPPRRRQGRTECSASTAARASPRRHN